MMYKAVLVLIRTVDDMSLYRFNETSRAFSLKNQCTSMVALEVMRHASEAPPTSMLRHNNSLCSNPQPFQCLFTVAPVVFFILRCIVAPV